MGTTRKLTGPQEDLLAVCLKRGIRDWNAMREYAALFYKYDNLTYRQLDEVFARIPLTVTG